MKKEYLQDEPGNGMVDLRDGRAFTKVFAGKELDFHNPECYRYWYILTKHLTFNENAVWIIDKKTNKLRPAHTHDEMTELLGIGRATYFRFYKECKERGYIAKFVTRTQKGTKFVVNPLYALNGNAMPDYLYNLFNTEDDDYEYDTIYTIIRPISSNYTTNISDKQNNKEEIKNEMPILSG